MKQPDSMIFSSNRKGTFFFEKKKLVPAKIDECGWFVNFSFKLAVWIFKKKIFKITVFKNSIRKKEANGSAWFRFGSIFLSRRARLCIHMVPKIDAAQDVYRES